MAPQHAIRRTFAAAAALSLSLLVAPALAGAAWTTPADLSATGADAYTPSVAVDDAGDAVFAWRRFDGANDRIEFQTRTAAGVLGVPQRLSRAGQPADSQQVAVDADGDAVFTWLRSDGTHDRVQARALSATGTLSNIRTLSRAGQDAHDPQVAVDEDGDAVITWRRFDGTNTRIQASALSSGGVVTGPATLSDAGEDALHPDVAVTANGDAIITWDRFDGTDDRVQAMTRSAAGVLSVPYTLSDAGGDARASQVDVDAGGDAYVVWERFDGTEFRVQSTILSAAGVQGLVHTISDPGGFAYNAQVAVDDNGDAVIVYDRTAGMVHVVHGVKMSPADTVGTPEALSDDAQTAAIPHVAVDDDGDGVVTWYRFDGFDNRIQAATIAANGVFGAPVTLSDAGERASSDRVAVDADGDAVVAWSRSDGTDELIQYAAGP